MATRAMTKEQKAQAELMAKVSEQFRDAYEKKRAMDLAEVEYEAARSSLYRLLNEANLKQYSEQDQAYLDLFDLASLEVKEVVKESTTVDVAEYRKHVTPEEFINSVKVSVEAAKKYLPHRLLGECTTKSSGAPYIQFFSKFKTKK